MNSLVHHLGQMLRLRSGPQHLPASWPLTTGVLGLYVAQTILASQHMGDNDAVPSIFLALAIQVLAVAGGLRFFGHLERLPQTLLAIAGTGIPIGLALFGVRLLASTEENQPVLFLVFLALIIWSVAVEAHIYRCAFSIALSLGVLFSVMIFAVYYIVQYFVFI